jgi:hypothetical protein
MLKIDSVITQSDYKVCIITQPDAIIWLEDKIDITYHLAG